jgi:DNA modification methylase
MVMNQILIGDCIESMRKLETGSIQTCVTSPPYYGLRSYCAEGTEEKNHEIGLEQTPDEYVAKMVDVFREVRRVLREDGTCWVNLGDSYAGSWGNYGGQNRGQGSQRQITNGSKAIQKAYEGLEGWRPPTTNPPGLKPKDLIGIPWRVAFALQADGWYLRQDIIWHKPNPMPESVTDRCTKAHEYIFLLSKSPRYFFDAAAIEEDAKWERWGNQTEKKSHTGTAGHLGGKTLAELPIRDKKNRRSVWTVTTKPYKGAHFATFPPDLIRPCILAGSTRYACEKCGTPHKNIVERTKMGKKLSERTQTKKEAGLATSCGGAMTSPPSSKIVGHEPDCRCNAGTKPSVVLDPFGGSGTTGAVSLEEGRNFVLCELNPEYGKLIEDRLGKVQPKLL